ncbi:MAG: ORF6N domain-containing protein [Bacteroidales bacterium]|nr:ORF6N domain-containing protein [Bacteroidales bacterium]
MTNIIEVENKIITLRDQQVILDSDVAELYGVQTKEINQAVRNNPEKFPRGYIFQLENQEFKDLRSKFLTTKYQKTRQLPKAFTEKGLYMLATILKSPQAVETTIAIVEAYAKLKELSRVMTQIPQQEENSVEQKTLLQRGGQLVEGLLTDVMPVRSSETSFELNLAMFKFKHSVKRENDEEIRALKERIEKLEQGEN